VTPKGLSTLNRRVLQGLVERELAASLATSGPGTTSGARPSTADRVRPRLLLVHGHYGDPTAEFTVSVNGETRLVRVSQQDSVLAAVAAWQEHLAAAPDGNSLLVITTGVGDDLGWDLRGIAIRGKVLTVERIDLVRQRFQATETDPRIEDAGWLVDALIDAEPSEGWPAQGGLLTLDTAVRALVGVRLGLPGMLGSGGLDVDTLLLWTRRPGVGRSFARLPEPERTGITAWLVDHVGPVAGVLLGLAAAGRAEDAVAIGVISAVAAAPDASPEAALALGGLLGGAVTRTSDLRALGEIVEGTLARWVAEAERQGLYGDNARRIRDIAEGADRLAAAAGLTDALTNSRILPSAFRVRVHTLAGALSSAGTLSSVGTLSAAVGSRVPGDGGADQLLAAVAAASAAVEEHLLARLEPGTVEVARMAVRVLRWLAEPVADVTSVADALTRQVGDWAWVDRALAVVWSGDPSGDPIVSHAYRRLHDAARARRDLLDERFANHLSRWAAAAATTTSGSCLPIENVLAEIAAPLVGNGGTGVAPLIVVLDGMSGAVAVELAEQLLERSWTEISPQPGRRLAAVSVLPSVTRLSRASLLSGALTSADQGAEAAAFAAFWRARRCQAVLFHKADLAGPAGHRLSEALVQALAGSGVVGVVLNTIDDALDHGREGDRTGWRLQDITFLPELLDAARGYGRPALLVSDHGHVLDRSQPGEGPAAASGVESARWRTGQAGPGEIEIRGPRVLAGGGCVVLPWREDLHYTPRKAGYHGGASLAEVTVPVLVFLPSTETVPDGWSVLAVEASTPGWWQSGPVLGPGGTVGESAAARPTRPGQVRQSETLFDLGADTPDDATRAEAAPLSEPAAGRPIPTGALGDQVVAAEVYALQESFVRKHPDRQAVAEVIDALVAAGGTLSLAAVAARAGRAGRNPEFFAATLERLLNVEGYDVVRIVDDGRTLRLNVTLLRQQFGITR
jgi:hypothetical protein